MSAAGRGRGYPGRHHIRAEARPGDVEAMPDELETVKPRIEPTNKTPESIKLDLKTDTKQEYKDEKGKPEPEIKYGVSLAEDEAALKELLTVDEQYTPLLVMLEQFSPGEDGIQFNRKLRQFESTVSTMCPDEARLLQAFTSFRAAALLNSSTCRKLAAVGASFTRQQRQQLLRGALLNIVMQGTYSKLDVLERANPQFLINAANLMGDYFAEARLCNGNKVHILASPLLQYMKALLVSDDIRAHRSLATQLMQNGRELLSVLAQELDDLSISIRIRLLTPPPVSIIWLLLSSDLCLNKFLPLPTTLQQFYASHLDLSSEDPNPTYNEVSYGSWKRSPEKEEVRSHSDSSDVSFNDKVSQLNLSHEDDHVKPKLRPILGAGAGLLRQEQTMVMTANQDSFDTWTAKSLAKRYDLNSWRQNEEQEIEEPVTEAVFNPNMPPPNLASQPFVPDYPPPSIPRFNSYPQPETLNYLQQGDGAYIQNQYPDRPPNSAFQSQGDGLYLAQPFPTERPATNFPAGERQTSEPFANQKAEHSAPFPELERHNSQFERQNSNLEQPRQYVAKSIEQIPERVNNEVQKTQNRRPLENWRKEKSDNINEERKTRNWTRQQSKESINDDDEKEGLKGEKYRSNSRNSRDSRDGKPGARGNRRNSSEEKTGPRRHVTEVPRSHKYWDHDDRCDIDYTS